ncbi:MAG: metal ABC transporter permease [Acidimicrobiia bacterium]|nr:metal ABC transporter permease [Acidimicrobiia bacterium]
MAAVDLLEPLQFAFFRNGLVVATVAGALCGLVGVFVVLRGMSYLGHGLSHAVFGGAALSAVLGISYFVGAGLWGLLSALLIGRVARRRPVGADAAIGVVTTASFAIGLAIQARAGTAARSIDAVLFGNVLGVFAGDIVAVLAVGVVVVVTVTVLVRRLLFVTFDPEVAAVSGIAPAHVDAVLMLLLSATILVTIRVVGVLLIAGLLVLPAVAARGMTDRFGRLVWLSPLLGALMGAVGMYASWFADVPSGAAIVLVGTVVVAAAFVGPARRRPALDVHV